MGSAYMEWVKTSTDVPFNLANSGVKDYPLSGLHVDFGSLTLSGPGAYGYAPLVKAIAVKEGVHEDCVATAQGTSMANLLAMAAVLEEGNDVLIERPAYPLLAEAAEYLGASVNYFDRPAGARFAIELDLLERAMTPKTRLIAITNLHNPSCALLDEATLRRVGEIARSTGARVLVDEVYLDLLFENAPESAFELGDEFIVTNSLTKVYGLSGLRCGWIVAEPKLIRKIYRLNDLFGVNNPYLTDQVSCTALAYLDEIAHWARELLDRNRALANEFVVATPEIDCEQIKVGTVLFPSIDYPVERFCRRLREHYETIVTPGHFFGSPERIRIGIGGETSLLAEGLARIHDALAEMGGE
jgi:aspartate/methionine/tyrosine aminotransferase